MPTWKAPSMSTSTEAQQRVTELKAVLATKGQEIKNLADSWKDETGQGHLVLTTQQHTNYVNAVNEAKQIKETIAATEAAAGIFEYLDAPADTPVGGQDQAQGPRFQMKSISQEFLDSKAYAEMKAQEFSIGGRFSVDRGIPDFAYAGQHAGASFDQKDVYSAQGGRISVPVIGRAENLGWTERMLRPGRV